MSAPLHGANGRRGGVWNRTELLDRQTQRDLAGCEEFYGDLYAMPRQYVTASAKGKQQLTKQWIQDLGGSGAISADKAAAYLGMARAREVAGRLGELLRSSQAKRNGRLRWVSTRSLGQTGDLSSVETLIGLLDNGNKETRVYARASLAHITGVYFGGDKARWRRWLANRQKSQPRAKKSEPARRIDLAPTGERLAFRLPDSFERIVDSSDYEGAPVLMMFGSCWCGGCQKDAEPFRKIAGELAPKGLRAVRGVAGDNELAALDFQKHYRLRMPQLMDTNRSFEKRYNKDGWTFLMLADGDGQIVYKTNSPREADWRGLRIAIGKMLRRPASKRAAIRDAVSYAAPTLQRSTETFAARTLDRFASLACGSDRKVYVVFTSTRNGTQDVYLRVHDGKRWSEDIPVAATADDEYDATVIVDGEGRPWISWTSNRSSKNYNIYVTSVSDSLRPSAPARLTRSTDDAMHARMACDARGALWVTYYEWRKMGEVSRDKEIFARTLRRGSTRWSEPIQVSPADVPNYEDHTDPALAATAEGVVAAWSWDFHAPVKGYSEQTNAPSIFISTLDDALLPTRSSSVSGKNIDSTPNVCVLTDGRIWCVWECIEGKRQKTVCIASPTAGEDFAAAAVTTLSDPAGNICTPTVFANPVGGVSVLWSERGGNGAWTLKLADYRDGEWAPARTLREKNNPRYAAGTYGAEGKLWIAYSVTAPNGRDVVAEQIDPLTAED